MNWFQTQAFNVLLPYLMGPLVFLVVQGLKRASALIDKTPPWVKQALVFVIAQVAAFAQTRSGQTLECGNDCTLADISSPAFVKGVLVTASAMLLHWLKNRPAPAK